MNERYTNKGERQWPADLDVRSGRTLKLNGAAEPEKPITRRIPVQPVAKQRIILIARDVRARLSSSAITPAFGESTLRGMAEMNETLERLPAPQEPQDRETFYRGADPFKAEVARALGKTEVCEPQPADAMPAFAEPSVRRAEAEEVSPFAQTTELSPPAELEHLLHLHEQTRRSLTDTAPTEQLEADLEERANDETQPRSARLIFGICTVAAITVIGNWPLSNNQLVQANLAGYSGAHQLTSTVAGRIAKLLVSVGDHVTASQPVLQLEEALPPIEPPVAQPSVDERAVTQLQEGLVASETRVEAQRGVLATLETKRGRLLEAQSATPAKLSALDDLVDAARGQLRSLESELLQKRQALEAIAALHTRAPTREPEPPSSLKAAHGGIVVHVHTVVGATIQPAAPVLSLLGDAAVPALIISTQEQEAELLLESPEVVLTVGDMKLTVLVTRQLDLPEEQAADDDRRSIELALHDSAQLAALAKNAEIGMPVVAELPEQRTLFSRASHWLRAEFE